MFWISSNAANPPSNLRYTRQCIKISLWMLAIIAWLSAPTWIEHTWAGRERTWLVNKGFTIIREEKTSDLLLPWTWFYPYTCSIVAVNLNDIRRDESSP